MKVMNFLYKVKVKFQSFKILSKLEREKKTQRSKFLPTKDTVDDLMNDNETKIPRIIHFYPLQLHVYVKMRLKAISKL